MQLPILAVKTACDVNPGDIFITYGTLYLVEKALQENISWRFISKYSSNELKSNKFHGKDFINKLDMLKKYKIMVYAGMPQYNNLSNWCLWYDKELFDHLEKIKDFKLIKLGGGGGYNSLSMTPDQFSKHLRSDKRTVEIAKKWSKYTPLVTVRDMNSHVYLSDIGIKNYLFPCPATFVSRYFNFQSNKNITAITVPSNNTLDDKYKKRLYEELKQTYNVLKKDRKVVIVCHYINEFRYIISNGIFPKEDIFYSNNFLTLLKFYSNVKEIVSCRLHGSLPVYGYGNSKVVNIKIDTRGNATELLDIPNLRADKVTSSEIIEKLKNVRSSNKSKLDLLEKQYCKLIRNTFKEIDNGRN